MNGDLNVEEIQKAARRLEGVIHPTPLDFSVTFSRLTGSRVYLKLENLQKTGSFKIRGAYNKICTLDEASRKKGVIAASAGNHAQGVAYAAAQAGLAALVVMPENAPVAKVTATQGYGARVVLAGEDYDQAFAHALALQKETGATFIHSFDDAGIIAGQGTIALELLAGLPDLDAVVVPVGGGGLIAGIALAVKTLRPAVKVVGVQAKSAPAVFLFFHRRESAPPPAGRTIADGISVRRPGGLTSKLIARFVDDIVLVDEEEIAEAILLLLERSKLVVEGAGAVGLAALLHGKISLPEKKVAVILSGGNVDINIVSIIIERGLVKSGRRLNVSVLLPDQPGSLSRLLALLAAARANLISVSHDRIKPEVPLREAEVNLVLETRDADHRHLILDTLVRNGYKVKKTF
ncbi:MAG: threonine ammonia-lyase [Armatimonadetes bacterium]|nr:threonine ammonia-lyase [Armatimonadota bacterium]